ncbi:cbb3-type cytochrome oxidase assembly protein CcoS [Halopseudomonas xiamenensis]|uniref:cbb3-type cytochrome oxidase assembly protein CcoS n=1 Tax=Halopseudomonas xiamenensis TaxID=157792 RepID=UPI001625AEB0|nr:cbb3-type cytochrome oxidase assembly protein CcoS [Halopseudomonas xiamenensis]
MTVLYILIPVAIVLVIVAILVFNWAVNSGQYDDLDSPAHSILFDEEDPAHLKAQQQAEQPQSKDDQQPADEQEPRA